MANIKRNSLQVCERCGGKTHKIHIHHKNADRTDNDKENLMKVCVTCHRYLHTLLGGKRDNYAMEADTYLKKQYTHRKMRDGFALLNDNDNYEW